MIDDGFRSYAMYREDIEFPNDTRLYNDKSMFQPLNMYRVIIHSPEELPYRTGHCFFHGKYDQVYSKVVTTLTKIDRDLESWTQEQRNCVIKGERKLFFFKIYSKANCEQECFSRVSLQTCGCVPFYMIRKCE